MHAEAVRQRGGSSIDIQSQPFMSGPGAAVKVDRAVVLGGHVIISGWVSGGITMLIQNAKKHVMFPRPDVSGAQFLDVKGFLVIVVVSPGETVVATTVRTKDRDFRSEIHCVSDPAEISVTLNEQTPRMPHIANEVFRDREWCKLVYPAIPAASSDSVAGYLEQAKCIPNVGVSLLGWAVSKGQGKLWLVAENGYIRELRESIRFSRPDIVEAFAADYGSRAEMAGFFCALQGLLMPGQKISVVAELGGQVFKLHERSLEKAPTSPIGYAHWAFGLPVPDSFFMERMERHDGDFLNQLIERGAIKTPEESVESWTLGSPPSSPMVSIIIPLYKRSDFVEHQLLSFAKDPDFRNGFAEIVYVIDDSGLLNSLKSESYFLHEFYGIPLRFVFGGRNRGFSGANNLGAGVAKGEYLIFLNSDVFPKEAGWVSRMVNMLLEKPQYGIVGARLLYPSGAVQHLGMSFVWSGQFGAWLNEHDGIGLPPEKGLPELVDRPAVTGACLAISRQDYEQIGGFDEGYLIGDFEDSDICLKVRALHKEIGCLTDTNLVHLERQSFKLITGEMGFRHKVVLFNAWRHTSKWSEQIQLIAR